MGIREYGYRPGSGKTGKNNDITDVPQVTAGHRTILDEKHRTGVTAVIPCEGNVFLRKPVAAVHTLNGFGKTMGTVQIEELGVLETPIILTNTLNVGKAADALVGYTIDQCSRFGKEVFSINPLVGETNDGRLNTIGDRVVKEEDVIAAISSAGKGIAQGGVGAGAGTVCFGLKGGIGSSSRVFSFDGKEYTLGVLVQSNYGSMGDLTVAGRPVGREIAEKLYSGPGEDRGSIMIIVGTDLPLTARQLKRVIKRAAVGMIRCGSYMGHGSGDVFLGFSNANCIGDQDGEGLVRLWGFPESRLDMVFRLTGEATEEAILNSMVCAEAAVDLKGETIHSLKEFFTEREEII